MSSVTDRKMTRQIHVGDIPVGGGAPVTVQSMTTTKTADVDGTLAQVYALRGAGADIVRITCNDVAAAQGLAEIVPRSPVPIIADIHFQYRLALAALEAGVAGLRLNPGNIRKAEHIKAVAVVAAERGVPIRVGVNAGSLDKDLLAKYGAPVPEALVESALHEIRLLEEVDFTDIKISVKHSHVPSMVDSYRLLSETIDYPLHLGVTEAGPGRRLLEQLGLRERLGLDLIACPSCGRAEVDVIAVVKEAQAVLEAENLPIQVAVMGCVVNGPGEAREADIGIAAGRGKGHLFIKGQVVRVVTEDEMVPALLDEARKLVEEGVEARLAAADAAAGQIAADTAADLLAVQGDANQAAERRAAVADVAGAE